MMKLTFLQQLSAQEQQRFSGGQNLREEFLQPLISLRGKPINVMGNAISDGSNLVLGNNTLQGTTSSGQFGSFGNSRARGEGGKTGAEDTMILPPFSSTSQTI